MSAFHLAVFVLYFSLPFRKLIYKSFETMSKVNDVASLYKLLKAEWGASKPNLSKCGQLLSDLKVCSMFIGYVADNDFAIFYN